MYSTSHGSSPPLATGSPLWACIALAWVASLGTGIGWNGVFFIAEQAYGFGARENLVLGAVMGAVYIAGALSVGRFVRVLMRLFGLSLRGVLIATLLVMAVGSVVPGVSSREAGLWFFAGAYLLFSGFMWPMVESFVSGGRRGSDLRRATGMFNIAWSSAIIVTMLGIAPTLRETPRVAFIVLSAAHLVCAALALRFSPSAGSHASAAHPHTEVEVALYRALLRAFRIGLFGSYVLMASLSPMLPAMLERLGVEVEFKTVLASSMLLSRVGVFVVLQRSDWWHGRWRTFFVSSVLLCGSFLATHLVGAGVVPGGAEAMAVGLALFGLGLGGLYAGAIYYAMETSTGIEGRELASVESGGVHEAMIGLGYTLGPLVALAALSGL